MIRPSERSYDQMRDISIERNYTRHGEGSVMIKCGDTHVLCTASVADGVPRFLRGEGQGWITAEYGMLPRSTGSRMAREAARGKQSGRTQEIQRLIGRSLRQAVDLTKLGEYTITIDCDVIQADGGTRTASITGACVALQDAISYMINEGKLKESPMVGQIAAISVGVYQGQPVLDLDYPEDSNAETDMNIVMIEDKGFVEIQGTAEAAPFDDEALASLLALGRKGCGELFAKQRQALTD